MVFVELPRLRLAQRTGPPAAFLPRIGPSGTSARHATANDAARMPFARSSLGGAFRHDAGCSPVGMDIDGNGFPKHVERRGGVSAVWAAAVEPRGAKPPQSIVPTEPRAVLHIHFRRVSACP